GKSAMIYAQYDIYKVDLSAEKPPVNITASLRGSHRTMSRFLRQAVYDPNENILIYALNLDNKDQGCFSLIPNRQNKPDSISMFPMEIVGAVAKARDASVYIVKRMDAKSSINLFYSSDLRKFTPLSNIHPEQKYNWVTSELVTWHIPDLGKSQG